jgi:hypothetical protein
VLARRFRRLLYLESDSLLLPSELGAPDALGYASGRGRAALDVLLGSPFHLPASFFAVSLYRWAYGVQVSVWV